MSRAGQAKKYNTNGAKRRVKSDTRKAAAHRARKAITKFYGVQACRAIFRNRRNDIARVFILAEVAPLFGDLIEWSRRRGIPHKIVEYDELSRVAATEHHEGVCCEASSLEPLPLAKFMSLIESKSNRCVLVLEGVENPHNVGAIVRTGCFFGVAGVALISRQLVSLSGAMCRVAEGALEDLAVTIVPDSGELLEALSKRGYTLVATTPHRARSVYAVNWPEKIALLFGAEGAGLSDELMQVAAERVVIPRVGKVESLNVGAAVASVLTEVQRYFDVGRKVKAHS